jgi:hypothetical protein
VGHADPQTPGQAELCRLQRGDATLGAFALFVQFYNELVADCEFVQNKSPRVRYSRGSI